MAVVTIRSEGPALTMTMTNRYWWWSPGAGWELRRMRFKVDKMVVNSSDGELVGSEIAMTLRRLPSATA